MTATPGDRAQPRRWDPANDERLAADYALGATLATLARNFGVTIGTVHARIRALRRDGAELEERKPRWSEERRSLLAERRNAGASLRELEGEFEITRGTLTYHLRVLRREGLLTERDGHGTPLSIVRSTAGLVRCGAYSAHR